MADAKAAVHDKNFTKFVETMDDLSAFFGDGVAAIQGCTPAAQDAKATRAVLAQIKGLDGLVKQIKQNLHDDEDDNIMMAFEDLFHAFGGEDYGQAGTDIGQLLHRLVIAAKYPDELQNLRKIFHRGIMV
jgi:hypothetical protein